MTSLFEIQHQFEILFFLIKGFLTFWLIYKAKNTFDMNHKKSVDMLALVARKTFNFCEEEYIARLK